MKTELISKLKTLLEAENALSVSEQFDTISTDFYAILKEEDRAWELEKIERIEAGEKPEHIERTINEENEEVFNLMAEYKARRKSERDEIKAVEQTNLQEKKRLINRLKDLINAEENIGKLYQGVNEIQDQWKLIGPIPRQQRQDIQKEYSTLLDDFRYNVKIYKEIADHDKAKNLQLKKEVIDELKALLEESKIKDVESKLHQLQQKWSEIGGTYQEEWDKIKDEFWNATNSVYDKIKAFYEERKEERFKNLEKKKSILSKMNELVSDELSSHKQWKSMTDKVLQLQEEWKSVGFGPKEENDLVWKEFRAECDRFFEKKKEFYAQRDSEFSGIKEKKEALIEQVSAFKDSTDWKQTTQKIIQIQKQWSQLGSAGPRFENKLWKAFRQPIDAFFDAKDAYFKSKDEANVKNLEEKQALIESIKNYQVSEDIQSTLSDLKTFAQQFKEIGHVPIKQKNSIYNVFKSVLDEKYNQLKLNEDEKVKVMFQAKIDSLLASPNPESALDDERYHIRQLIDKKIKEKIQFENNLGFFAMRMKITLY